MKIKTASAIMLGATLNLLTSDAMAHDAQIIADTFNIFLGDSQSFKTATRERGVPVMHDLQEPECHAHHLCSQKGEHVILQAGHHLRSQKNDPIFGVLTQPLPTTWKDQVNQGSESYIESSHVQFLESAGARVIAIDYRLSDNELKKILGQVNGVYIPGDAIETLQDDEYSWTVGKVLKFAQSNNSKNHFPVVGTSYGSMSMLRSQLRGLDDFMKVPEEQIQQPLQVNQRLMPVETFLYDEIDGIQLDKLFDQITFYNELELNVSLEHFINLKGLKSFVPASTFDFKDSIPMNQEFVSVFEGTLYPFFGFAYRVDKVQFGFDPNETVVDHSRESLEHAQHIANFLVDEARLSSHTFEWTNQETQSILSRNQQAEMVKLPKKKKDISDSFFYTELYLFQ